jgi:hypothetical protein
MVVIYRWMLTLRDGELISRIATSLRRDVAD